MAFRVAALMAAAVCSMQVSIAAAQGGQCPAQPCADQPGKVAVPKNTRPWSNGCSVPPFIQMPDFSFEKCCDNHDSCYMSCGVSKDECEKSFGSCLKKHCKAKYPGNEECISTANTYVMGVTAFGCNGYQESQVIGCECVAPAKAEEHTEKVVTNFFAKYNKTKTPEEVSAALAQYKGKVGTMLNRLYRKYPEAIEIISRDGQAQKRRGEEL
mmetsp:Transcript_1034/g.2072  ORF Transcript_1034/g.2072 Transcript_1034/m.2072 type:complete len:212 (-) Transcript_1034:192-827(-)